MRTPMPPVPQATTHPPDTGQGHRIDDTPNDRSPVPAITVVIHQDRVARHLRQDILSAVAGEPRDLVIDLRQVANLPATGLATLVGVQARQRSRLKSLTLVCGDRSDTQKALARSGMKGDFRTVTEIPPPW
jgi:anti-anti-sigma regulatory factor